MVVARFSPDGHLLVTACSDGTARLWDSATGKMLALMRNGKRVADVEFSRDGRLLVTASDDRLVRIWDLAPTDRWPMKLSGDAGVVRGSFSPDGTRAVTAGGDHSMVRVWDAVRGTLLFALPPRGRDYAELQPLFSPDGRLLLTQEGTWDANTGQAVAMIPTNYNATSQAWSSVRPAEKCLISGYYATPALVLDAYTGKLVSPPL